MNVNFPYEAVPWRPACIALGVFFTSGGFGILDPVRGAQLYGYSQPGAGEARIYPAAACRNMSLGVAILALTLTGQPKALGTVLLAFNVMALADIYIVLGWPNVPAGSLAMHIGKIVVMPVLAGKLLGVW